MPPRTKCTPPPMHPCPLSHPLQVEECRAEVERVVHEHERSRVEHEQQIADLASTLQMYQVHSYTHHTYTHARARTHTHYKTTEDCILLQWLHCNGYSSYTYRSIVIHTVVSVLTTYSKQWRRPAQCPYIVGNMLNTMSLGGEPEDC